VFAGFRFPREVISLAVRWYLRCGLSYRDVGELLAERGITVDHVTVYRLVQRFTRDLHAPAGYRIATRPAPPSQLRLRRARRPAPDLGRRARDGRGHDDHSCPFACST
jgi:hypothetical protein